MKKTVSLVLAILLAFSCLTVAFAADEPTTKKVYTCPYSQAHLVKGEGGDWVSTQFPCGKTFTNKTLYDIHLKTCPYNLPTPLNTSINDLLTAIVQIASTEVKISGIVIKAVNFIIDLIGKIPTDKSAAAGVDGAVADLESALKGDGIDITKGAIKDLLDTLKLRIKQLYCGEVATTAAAPSPATGSASTGIAAFSAVCVAAAAAYVCAKKKAD